MSATLAGTGDVAVDLVSTAASDLAVGAEVVVRGVLVKRVARIDGESFLLNIGFEDGDYLYANVADRLVVVQRRES